MQTIVWRNHQVLLEKLCLARHRTPYLLIIPLDHSLTNAQKALTKKIVKAAEKKRRAKTRKSERSIHTSTNTAVSVLVICIVMKAKMIDTTETAFGMNAAVQFVKMIELQTCQAKAHQATENMSLVAEVHEEVIGVRAGTAEALEEALIHMADAIAV